MENVKSIYDIVLDKAYGRELACSLEKLPGTLEVKEEKEKVSVSVKDPESSGKELMSFFASQDVSVKSFSLRRASLEDIFLEEVKKGEH